MQDRSQQRNQLDGAAAGPYSPTSRSVPAQSAYRAYSERSNSTSRRGRSARICRHSSAPIEPPAPVTITTFAADPRPQQRWVRLDRIAAQNVRDLDFAEFVNAPGAAGQFRQVGKSSTRTGNPASASRISRRRRCEAEGSASKSSYLRAGRSDRGSLDGARTLRPRTTLPHSCGLSSTNTTGANSAL
jgi:hypothetical protein